MADYGLFSNNTGGLVVGLGTFETIEDAWECALELYPDADEFGYVAERSGY